VIVFVNGIYSPEQSVILDKDLTVSIQDTDSTKNECDPFDLLNCAFTKEVVHLSIKPSISIQHPVAIVYYFDSTSAVFGTPRWRCEIGKNSSLTILEYSIVSRTVLYFNNKQSEIRVGENAQLEYTLLQNGPKSEIQLNNTHLYLETTSRVACFTLSFDGQLIRNNLTLTLDGQGIDAHLYGLYLVSGKTVLDNHTIVDHRSHNSYSNQLYKGVMDEYGKGIFNGKIFVRPDAQKTNAFQSNRNILLGDFATINTKPQLEIWADDVKCSHGCTTGQLDEEALFYLRSRGISKELARGMLLEAFAGETLLTMKNQPIRNYVETLIVTKLHQAQ
jgi:Fe-S cluster assembly protein SufD